VRNEPKKRTRIGILWAAAMLLVMPGDCCLAQQPRQWVPTKPDARRLEAGMPLDWALAMLRTDRIECHEYFIAARRRLV